MFTVLPYFGSTLCIKEEGMITSTANARIKQLALWNQKAKARREDGVFLAEGVKMFEEAPVEWLREVYLAESFSKKIPETLLAKLLHCSYEVVDDSVFAKASDTQTPQGILSVLTRPRYTLQDVCAAGQKPPLIMVLENLQDPGNLGTILRTGEGAGITGVILTKETVDIFNPKTIRATMGSIYRVPFVIVDSIAEAVTFLKQNGLQVYAAHLKGTCNYHEPDYTGGSAFLIGNEGNGLKEETAALADTYIRIPMEGNVESLNAAIASAILMYEAYRQRSL